MKAFTFERSSTPTGLVRDTNMAPDMTRKGSIRCFIFLYLKTGYIVHNRHNRPRKARQSEENLNTPSETKKRKKAKSKTGHLMNYFCLFVCFVFNLFGSICLFNRILKIWNPRCSAR